MDTLLVAIAIIYTPHHARAMGAFWEACNGLTMAGPVSIIAYSLYLMPCSLTLAFVCYAIAAHAPFAITYHLSEAWRLAMGEPGDPIDNEWRRADQVPTVLITTRYKFA